MSEDKNTRDRGRGTSGGARVVLSPSLPRYRLTDLLKDTTPEALRDSFAWDEPRGREVI